MNAFQVSNRSRGTKATFAMKAIASMAIAFMGAAFPQSARAEEPSSGKIILVARYEGTAELKYELWDKDRFASEMSDAEGGPERTPSRAPSGIVDGTAGPGLRSCEIAGIRPGTYMINVFADVNGNGVLDEGAFGPSEPWGMSGLKKKPLFRAPRFDEVSFPLSEGESVKVEVAVK